MTYDDRSIGMDDQDDGCGHGRGDGTLLTHAVATELEQMVMEMVTRSDEPGACRAILRRHGHLIIVLVILITIQVAGLICYGYVDLSYIQATLSALYPPRSIYTPQPVSPRQHAILPPNVTLLSTGSDD
jgi:hypothetical protein